MTALKNQSDSASNTKSPFKKSEDENEYEESLEDTELTVNSFLNILRKRLTQIESSFDGVVDKTISISQYYPDDDRIVYRHEEDTSEPSRSLTKEEERMSNVLLQLQSIINRVGELDERLTKLNNRIQL